MLAISLDLYRDRGSRQLEYEKKNMDVKRKWKFIQLC